MGKLWFGQLGYGNRLMGGLGGGGGGGGCWGFVVKRGQKLELLPQEGLFYSQLKNIFRLTNIFSHTKHL